jgi:cytochrome c-type biogenesis protein CcmH/NrfG
MSEDNQSVKASWTSVQVYAMSLLCLLVGVTVGYLFRGSAAHQTSGEPKPAIAQAQMPTMNTGENPQQPGPEQMKQMADKKVAPLLEQLSKNPRDSDTLIKVGNFYQAARQFDEAAKYFQKAVDVKPTADTLTKLSNAQYYGGAGDQAIETLYKALQIDPKFANALFNLGMLKWQVKGDTKGAIASWEELLRTNPHHPNRDQVEKMIARAKEHAKLPPGAKSDKPAM